MTFLISSNAFSVSREACVCLFAVVFGPFPLRRLARLGPATLREDMIHEDALYSASCFSRWHYA